MSTPDALLTEQSLIKRGVAEWYYQQPMLLVLLVQSVAAFAIALYFWRSQSHAILLGWLGYTWFCSILFGVTTVYFRRVISTNQHLDLDTTPPLEGIATGIGWGMPSLWHGVMTDTSGLLLTTVTAMGAAAASVGILAPNWRAFYWCVLLAILPFVGVFIADGVAFHFTLAIMLLIFLALVLLSGANMKRAVISSITLRVKNLSLVSELTEKNLQAEQARSSAEQANLSKSKFLAAASHDLRQPLHALGLFVDVLESRIRYPEVRSIVDNIKISTEALAELFNALLDISKLDAGVLEPKLADVALQPLLQRMLTDYRPKAESNGIILRIRDCHAIIRTDAAMFERILRNLVSNAVRYTQHGGVLLGCRRRADTLQIDIFDTGIGIPPDKLDKIFEEFYQVENPERDRRKGLGLGLAIVKRLGQLLNVPVEVRSILQHGTRFRVTVPLVVAEAMCESDVPIAIADVNNAQVLIIDDEALIRTGMQELLRNWGCKVVAVESAAQALELLTAQNLTPDIIVTDYRLREEKTGIEAINLIRTDLNKFIPAILITGDTDPDRLREANNSGLHLLHKPVSPSKLRALLSYLLKNIESS